MSDLKKALLKQITVDLPKQILREIISTKLENAGCSDPNVTDIVVDRMIVGNFEDFSWDDGSELNSNITISLSEEDQKTILAKLDDFRENKIQKIVNDMIEDGASEIVKGMFADWQAIEIDERAITKRFEDRLYMRWCDALVPLEMLLLSAREVGDRYSKNLKKSRVKRGRTAREAIVMLHMRACQTAGEIIVLLKSGYADGADARWRTLYEIALFAKFILHFGDDAAERYFAHSIVKLRESEMRSFKIAGKNYDPSKLRGFARQVEKAYQECIQKYGVSFSGRFGWAAQALKKGAPTLDDLESSVDDGVIPLSYKWSSFKVHADASGSLHSLGVIGERAPFLAGASNAGIHWPATNTAYSLLHVTGLLFHNRNSIEASIELKALLKLRDLVAQHAQKAARALENEELGQQFDSK